MNKVLIILMAVVVALILMGGSFWQGMNMGQAQAQSAQNSFFASRGFNPNDATGAANDAAGGANHAAGGAGDSFSGGAGAANARGAVGTIQKIDGNTITITTSQGLTETVTIANNTPILKTVDGSKSDLQVGGHITVIGQRSGNNVAATAIQITDRPADANGLFPDFGAGRREGATPTPAPKN